jgi:hypothetical protein
VEGRQGGAVAWAHAAQRPRQVHPAHPALLDVLRLRFGEDLSIELHGVLRLLAALQHAVGEPVAGLDQRPEQDVEGRRVAPPGGRDELTIGDAGHASPKFLSESEFG